MSTTSPVVPQQQKPSSPLGTLQALLDKYKGQIAAALPKHLSPERMIRVALTAVSQNRKLQECDALTICGAVVQASLLGLEVNSVLGEAYLVPFFNKKAKDGKGGMECQLITGYQGKLKLVRNTDQLVTVAHDVVREHDAFEFENGLDPILRHKKGPGTKIQRGAITHFWAGVRLKNGGSQIAVMTLGEMEEHRDDYCLSKDRNGKIFGTWVDEFEKMGLKTVLHAVTKLCPKSTQAQAAWNLDENHDNNRAQAFSVDVPLELHGAGNLDADADVPIDPVTDPKRKSEAQQQDAGKSEPQAEEDLSPKINAFIAEYLQDAKRYQLALDYAFGRSAKTWNQESPKVKQEALRLLNEWLADNANKEKP